MYIGKVRAANRAHWRQIIEELEQSGQRMQEFASHKGLNLAQVARWQAKFAAMDRNIQKHFVDVAVLSEANMSSGIRVRIGNEVSVDLSSLPPAEWIVSLARGFL